jgi:hypothetical protein
MNGPHRFNLSLHYHAGEIDTCWRLIGGTGAVETSTSGCPSLPRSVQNLIESPTGDFKLVSVGFLLGSFLLMSF